jgi:hypothetical protein
MSYGGNRHEYARQDKHGRNHDPATVKKYDGGHHKLTHSEKPEQ